MIAQIDQIKDPENYNPARQIKGMRQLAKFIERVALPARRVPLSTVGDWLKAGLLPAPVEIGAGARPSIWVEGAVIEGLKSAQRAAEVVLDHRASKPGRPSLTEMRVVQLEIEQAAANDSGSKPSQNKFLTTAKDEMMGFFKGKVVTREGAFYGDGHKWVTDDYLYTEQSGLAKLLFGEKVVDPKEIAERAAWEKSRLTGEGWEENRHYPPRQLKPGLLERFQGSKDEIRRRQAIAAENKADQKIKNAARLKAMREAAQAAKARVLQVVHFAASKAAAPAQIKQKVNKNEAARPSLRAYEGLSAARNKSNVVEYINQQTRKVVFVDAGNKISIQDPQNPESVKAAMRHAAERNNNPFQIRGSDEFKKSAAAAAYALGCQDRINGIPPNIMAEAKIAHEREKQANLEKQNRPQPELLNKREAADRQRMDKVKQDMAAEKAARNQEKQASLKRQRQADEKEARAIVAAGGRPWKMEIEKATKTDLDRIKAQREQAVAKDPKRGAFAFEAENRARSGRMQVRNDAALGAIVKANSSRDSSIINSTGEPNPRLRLEKQLGAQQWRHSERQNAYEQAAKDAELPSEKLRYEEKAARAGADRQKVIDARTQWQNQGMPTDPEAMRQVREQAGFKPDVNTRLMQADHGHQEADQKQLSGQGKPKDEPRPRIEIQEQYQAEHDRMAEERNHSMNDYGSVFK